MNFKNISAFHEWLNEKSESLRNKSSYIYWVSGGEDAGLNYCNICVKFKARHERNKAKKDRSYILVDGGWDLREEDITCFCEGCGEPLNHLLTEEGYRNEFENFISQPPNELSELDALELARVFDKSNDVDDGSITKLFNVLQSSICAS